MRVAPPAPREKKAEKLADELFADDIAHATTPAGKKILAQKLFDTAATTNDDPAGRFVLLKMARNEAVDIDDLELALNAVRQLDQFYKIDALTMDGEIISRIVRKTTTPEELTAFADQILPLCEQAMKAERFDLARQWAELARNSAQRRHDAARVAAASSQIHNIAAADLKARTIARSVAALKANPNDPEANLTVGLFHCVDKGDWHTGLPLFARGSDASLKALAEAELKAPTNPAARSSNWPTAGGTLPRRRPDLHTKPTSNTPPGFTREPRRGSRACPRHWPSDESRKAD